MPFIIASCVLKKTFTIASAPSCRDSHTLPVAAGRAPHALQTACASRAMRPTVMFEPIVTDIYVHASVIPLAASRHIHWPTGRVRSRRGDASPSGSTEMHERWWDDRRSQLLIATPLSVSDP